MYKVDQEKTRKKAKGRTYKGGITSGSQNSSKNSQEEKVASKLAKGISSLFSRNTDSKSQNL